MILIRAQCKTCPRFVHPRELIIGLCPVCFSERLEERRDLTLPDDVETVRCADCNGLLLLEGYRHWDVLGKCWVITCLTCNDKRANKDLQYRNTEFAFEKRIQ